MYEITSETRPTLCPDAMNDCGHEMIMGEAGAIGCVDPHVHDIGCVHPWYMI